MKHFYFALIFLSSLLISTQIQSQVTHPFQNPTLSIDDRVDDLIDLLTLEEKAGQLMYGAAAVPRLGIPAYNWWNESLHGVARNGRATIFPQAIGLAATFDTDLVFRVASAISDEARAKFNATSSKNFRARYQGLTFWTPNVNIFRDPRWGRGQETYGEDPFLTAKMGVAYVKGLQGNHPKYLKASALAKHYAVHNGPEVLRHEFDAVVNQQDLWDTYLPAFKALVQEGGVTGMMGAYNRTNGDPMCAHPYLMKEVLREQWGYKGYYVSDCWALVDFYNGHKIVGTAEEAAAMALKAGCNLNCGSVYESVLSSVKQGLVTEDVIDQNLRELFPTRFRLGLFDPVGSGPFDKIGTDLIRADKHIELSKEAATKSMVLLKNEEETLPLDKETRQIFITGPMAAHTQALLANYYGMSDNLVTFMEGIISKVSDATMVNYAQGALMDRPNVNPIDWFSGNAEEAEVTIAFMGISQLMEGEEGESIASAHFGDREDIGVPQHQIDFLKLIRSKAKKLVVVLTSGSAMTCPEVYEMADALVYAWYPGEQGGAACADILFGDAVPSGRLPVTVVNSIDDLPPYDNYDMNGRTYRYMDKKPQLPFGFGLSYTRFDYSDMKVSQSTIKRNKSFDVTVEVKNVGDYAAEEVVQLYIKDTEASTRVPNHSLKAFTRVNLKPGEQQKVRFTVEPAHLEIVNDSGERVVEAGSFKISVGGSQPTQRSLDLGATKFLTETIKIR